MAKNLKNTAYNIIKERLINCEYPPGSILKESDLAAELGFSRTPIREAISLLETEGYLVIAPKKGIFVTDISLNDVLQIFQVRLAIEPIALKMAAPNLPVDDLISLKKSFIAPPTDQKTAYQADAAMHLYLISHCKNKYIIDMMNTVFDKNARIVISSNQNLDHAAGSRKEHVEILDALINQDIESAVELLYTHISHCRKSALDHFYNV